MLISERINQRVWRGEKLRASLLCLLLINN